MTNPDGQIDDLPLETETADDVKGGLSGSGGSGAGKAGQSHEGGGIAQ
jgi:hypothetical protein